VTTVHFDATSVGDGVLARCTDENLAGIMRLLDELLLLLDDGVVPPHRRRWWRTPSAATLLRRMFPVTDDFWERHRESLADPGPARRVRAKIDEPTPWLVGFDEVEDWIIAFAQLRSLYQTRRDATTAVATTFLSVPEQLTVALHPSSATGWPLT